MACYPILKNYLAMKDSEIKELKKENKFLERRVKALEQLITDIMKGEPNV